jgi:hypothetical protein
MMNERIQKLAEQAGWDLWEGRAQRDMTGCDTELQKFAELIVRECADIGNNAYSDVGNYTYIGDKIKQHFGVEQ